MNYYFPGNIRELKAVVELAAVMSDGDNIEADDITINTKTSVNDMVSEETTLKAYENKIVAHFLKKYDNDISLVAEKLDIGKSTIYKMMQRGEV